MANDGPPVGGRPRFVAERSQRRIDVSTDGPESDTTVYWVVLVVGLTAVVPVAIRGGVWGAEPTLGAVLAVLAGRALLVTLASRIRERSGHGS